MPSHVYWFLSAFEFGRIVQSCNTALLISAGYHGKLIRSTKCIAVAMQQRVLLLAFVRGVNHWYTQISCVFCILKTKFTLYELATLIIKFAFIRSAQQVYCQDQRS